MTFNCLYSQIADHHHSLISIAIRTHQCKHALNFMRTSYVLFTSHWQAQKRHNLSILHGVGESNPVEKEEV